MDITTRHIRSNWAEWIDWPESVIKTSSTMCGKRTRSGLCGIPGVTVQSTVVEKGGKRIWGWCTACVSVTWPYLFPPALSADFAPPEIFDLHQAMYDAISEQYERTRKRN